MQEIYGGAGGFRCIINNDKGICEGATAACLRKVVTRMVQLGTRGRSSETLLRRCTNFVRFNTIDLDEQSISARCDVVVSAGGVAALVMVLQQGPSGAKCNAAGALSYSPVSEQHHDVALSAGGVAALIGVLQQGPDDAKQHAAGALSNLTVSEQHLSSIVMWQ